MSQGKLIEAEELARKALAISTKHLGAAHQRTINFSGNVGRMLIAQGEPEGKALVQQALGGLQAAGLPPSHPWIAKFNKVLADA